MCEYSGKLVAWIDGELPASEASEIECHVASCADCRSCLAEFRKVSGAFEAYCEEQARAAQGRQLLRLQPILWTAAAAILLAAIFGYSRWHVAPTASRPSRTAIAATTSFSPVTMPAVEGVPVRLKPVHHRARRAATVPDNNSAASPQPCPTRDCVPANMQAADPATEGPAIEIAIPADAMFPPGAVPDGVSFFADLSIGADGTVQQVRLQPQISELERRSSQP